MEQAWAWVCPRAFHAMRASLPAVLPLRAALHRSPRGYPTLGLSRYVFISNAHPPPAESTISPLKGEKVNNINGKRALIIL